MINHEIGKASSANVNKQDKSQSYDFGPGKSEKPCAWVFFNVNTQWVSEREREREEESKEDYQWIANIHDDKSWWGEHWAGKMNTPSPDN